MQGHGLAVAGGEYEPGAFSFGRADGAENIGRTRPLVVRRRRPCPAFRPSAGDLVFLPDAGFVLEPKLYLLAASLVRGDFLHEGEKVFLKAAAIFLVLLMMARDGAVAPRAWRVPICRQLAAERRLRDRDPELFEEPLR
jgi:hypothetical protein